LQLFGSNPARAKPVSRRSFPLETSALTQGDAKIFKDQETIGWFYDVRLDPSSDHALESVVASRRLPRNGRPGFIALKKWLNDPKT
jgi:hypothetical protein